MNKNLIKIIIKLVITILLLSWFFYRTDINALIKIIGEGSLIVFALANIFHFVAMIFGAYKWKIIIPQFEYIKLLKLYIIGAYYSMILLGQVSGEVAKAYILGKGSAQSEKVAMSVIIDKITGLIGLFILSIWGLLNTKIIAASNLTNGFIAGIVSCIILLFALRINIFFTFSVKILIFLQTKIKKLHKAIARILELLNAWRDYSKNTRIMFLSILMSIVYQMFPVLIFSMLGTQYGITLHYYDWCWVIGFLSIVLLLPISIAGLGVREGTLIGVLGWLGFSTEQALALSFSILGVQIIGALAGAFFEIKRKA